MRIASIARLALASCLIMIIAIPGMAQRLGKPEWVEPDAHRVAASPTVERAAEALLEQTLAGTAAQQQLAAIARISADTTLTPAQRDAVLHVYLRRLRDFAPGTAPPAVLAGLSQLRPLAVIAHEEGAHHGVALFNIASAARGLANEWAWRDGHDAVAGSTALPLSTLAEELGRVTPDGPRFRGMRFAIGRLPAPALEALAARCAMMPGGCGRARADIELARGNVRWLKPWLASAAAAEVVPRLRDLRRFLTPPEERELLKAALSHPNKGVAARAMSDLTSSMPKDDGLRREWGSQLVGLLDDPQLGAAAALQLARFDTADWLEAAANQPLGEVGQKRLELLAELENTVKMIEPDHRAER